MRAGTSTTPIARPTALSPARAAQSSTIYHFDKADVVVSLDADFLACGPGSVRYSKDFAGRRRVTDDNKAMNRLYAIESTPSLTGAKADHRLALRASEIEGFAAGLAAAIGAGGGTSARTPSADETTWIAAIAKDLQAHKGSAVVVAGDYQPDAVHARGQGHQRGAGEFRDDRHLRGHHRGRADRRRARSPSWRRRWTPARSSCS